MSLTAKVPVVQESTTAVAPVPEAGTQAAAQVRASEPEVFLEHCMETLHWELYMQVEEYAHMPSVPV